MRPVIKKKRIDPRYFLHETVEESVRLNVAEKLVEPEDKEGEEGEETDRKPEVPGKQRLLKGEKTLYEKIRTAIEEVFDEHLKENK